MHKDNNMASCNLEKPIERRRVMDVAEVVALERQLNASGTSLAFLMDCAGRELALEVACHFGTSIGSDGNREKNGTLPVVVLAGSGNNGGDGWVAARYLAAAGFPVTIVSAKSAEDIKAEPAHSAALETMAAGLSVAVVLNPSEQELEAALSSARVVMDCLLGTGFHGAEVREPYGSWIATANSCRSDALFALAADVPSGLSAQDGGVANRCFEADATVSMLALKPGLVAEGSEKHTGALRLAPLVGSAE